MDDTREVVGETNFVISEAFLSYSKAEDHLSILAGG